MSFSSSSSSVPSPSPSPSPANARHATVSAYLMLGSGVALSVMGFYEQPVGEISDSVLWLLGQTLLYAGSIFGVTVYVRELLRRPDGGGAAPGAAPGANNNNNMSHSSQSAAPCVPSKRS